MIDEVPPAPQGYKWRTTEYSDSLFSLILESSPEAAQSFDAEYFCESKVFASEKGMVRAATTLLRRAARHEKRVAKIQRWNRSL